MADPLIVTWILIGLSTGKFDEDLDVKSYATKQECVTAGASWEDWSCFPVGLPAGVDFVVVNKPSPPPTCFETTGWFGLDVKVVPCGEPS